MTIGYLWRALEEYGVTSSSKVLDQVFAQFFLGFSATPDDSVLMLPSGKAEWWEVLGVKSDANREAIRNAYWALSKVHHPDAGGDPATFQKLNQAYEEAMGE